MFKFAGKKETLKYNICVSVQTFAQNLAEAAVTANRAPESSRVQAD